MEDVMPYLVGWAVPTALAAVAGYLGGQVKRLTARDRAIEEGLRSILRMELTDAYQRYCVDNDPLSLARKRELEEVGKAYFALGGNGTGRQLYEELMELQHYTISKKGDRR